MIFKRPGSLFLLVFLASGFSLWVTSKQAHAYIDVGSATFFLQMLIASIFGGLFALKIFWRRAIGRVSRLLAMLKGTNENPG